MKTTINERIAYIADYFFKGNTSAMARATSIKQSTLRDIIGERQSTPSFETIKNIVDCATLNINPDWLIIGKGEMLKPSQEDGGVNQVGSTYVGSTFVGYGNASNNKTYISGDNSTSNKEPDQLKEIESLKAENKELINEVESLKAEMNMLKGENRILREQLGLGERKESSKIA